MYILIYNKVLLSKKKNKKKLMNISTDAETIWLHVKPTEAGPLKFFN
jgi:hypothetical protein